MSWFAGKLQYRFACDKQYSLERRSGSKIFADYTYPC